MAALASPAYVDVELWRPIPDWTTHEASTHGQIRRVPWIDASGRLHLGGILARYTDKRPGKGYLYVTLVDGRRKRNAAVHVLVLEAWKDLKRGSGLEGCHINGVRTDNHVSNLYVGSKVQNRADRERHRRERAVTAGVTREGGNGGSRYGSKVRPGAGTHGRPVTPAVSGDGGPGTVRCPIPSTFSFFPPSVKSAFRVLRPRKGTH